MFKHQLPTVSIYCFLFITPRTSRSSFTQLFQIFLVLPHGLRPGTSMSDTLRSASFSLFFMHPNHLSLDPESTAQFLSSRTKKSNNNSQANKIKRSPWQCVPASGRETRRRVAWGACRRRSWGWQSAATPWQQWPHLGNTHRRWWWPAWWARPCWPSCGAALWRLGRRSAVLLQTEEKYWLL